MCPLGVWCCVSGVLGHLAPVHRCARLVRCVACAVSWATWLLFTGVPDPCVVLCVRCPGPLWLLFTDVPARCVVVLGRCPGPLGSFSPVCPLGALLFVCGGLNHLAPVYRCARSVCCCACAVSWASWLLFTSVPARCVVLRVQCPGPLGSCSPVCPLGALFCLCGVLGHLAPVHRCASSVRCLSCAVSGATWLLVTNVHFWCVVLLVRCPGPLGSCSPVCPLGALPACAVSLATWLLFTGVPAWCVVLLVRCPGPLGFRSPVCPLGALLCLLGVLGHLAPVHRCARSVRSFACAVSLATWPLFTGVPAWCVVLLVRCPGPLGSCSPVCPLGPLLCLCGVLAHLAPVHLCAGSLCCLACAVSWATWLLFTGVPARCVACVCGVLGRLAPVQRCARSACCVACAVSRATWLPFTSVPFWCVVLLVRCPGPLSSCSPVCPLGALPACAMSWATWLLFRGVPAWCVVLLVRCPGPLGSCPPVFPLGVLCCVCAVLGHLAPVHRCARSACCVVCAVSWATWLLFTGVPALCAVWRMPCPGPLGSRSPVCPLGMLCCVCGVLGHLAPVHRCARSVCSVACAVSWATRLLFTGVPARRVVLCVRCPGPLGSCSPVCPLGALPACAVSWATWLLFTCVPARRVVLCVRCPGPPGLCSPVCPLGALFCLCGVLGHLAPVHRCDRSVRCLRVRCPGPLGSWSPMCPFGALFYLCGVLGHLAPVHRCARSVRCLRVRCPGPLGSCSRVCPLGALFCLCGVLGHLAPVHRCSHSACCVACAVFWATWLPFTGVPARRVVLCVRCPGPLSSCSPVCPLCVQSGVCGVLGHLAPVRLCARSACCVVCAVSWATWLLFNGLPARCAVWRVRCPGPLGSCSPLCPLGALPACAVSRATWLRFTGVPARRVVLRVRCPGPPGPCSPVCPLGALPACAVSWATWLLFTVVPAWCVVLLVRCPGPLGSGSPVCPLCVLSGVCVVPGHLARVHRCARSACCVACAVSWATWLLFTGVTAQRVVLCVRCPGGLGSCSPVCPLCLLCGLCGALGHLAPVHRCARSVRCFACAVSWATWLLFTGVPARCVVVLVQCPGPLGSCSRVCPLGVLFCLCGVLGHFAPVHRCVRLVRCVACAVA